MGAALGAILPEAIGVAISPIPIIAVVLLLSTPKGKGNAFGFLIGWLVGLAVVGTLVLLLADPAGATTDNGPATWLSWLVLGLGALLILLGIKKFVGRPRDGVEPPLPKWMAAIDQFSFGKSLGLGFVLSAVNPKNLILTLAAAASIATAALSTSDSFVVLCLFVLIGTITLAMPIAIYLLAGHRAADILMDLRLWLTMHNAAIMSVLFVVIGAKIAGDGISGLLG
jgi:threonine/homoserine/homoserine lactone efflux protein